MSRKDRKKLTQKKLAGLALDINEVVAQSFKMTKDWREAFRLTDKYINEQMCNNPQEAHIWERAAHEWREKFENELKKEGLVK